MSNHYYSSKPTSELKKGLIKTKLRGQDYTLLSGSGVFSVKKVDNGSRVLIESMELPSEGEVLDIGCGYGVIGIVVATQSPKLKVTLTDVNPRATYLAKENITRMGLTNVEVLTGDLYEPVRDRNFQLIISNPPISSGMSKVVQPLVIGAVEHLDEGGSLQLVIQWNKGGRILARYLEETFGSYEILARNGGYRVLKSVF